jgi:hypothetical protein
MNALRDAIAHEAGYRDFCRARIRNAKWIIELTGFRNGREYTVRRAPEIADENIRAPVASFSSSRDTRGIFSTSDKTRPSGFRY